MCCIFCESLLDVFVFEVVKMDFINMVIFCKKIEILLMFRYFVVEDFLCS